MRLKIWEQIHLNLLFQKQAFSSQSLFFLRIRFVNVPVNKFQLKTLELITNLLSIVKDHTSTLTSTASNVKSTLSIVTSRMMMLILTMTTLLVMKWQHRPSSTTLMTLETKVTFLMIWKTEGTMMDLDMIQVWNFFNNFSLLVSCGTTGLTGG